MIAFGTHATFALYDVRCSKFKLSSIVNKKLISHITCIDEEC